MTISPTPNYNTRDLYASPPPTATNPPQLPQRNSTPSRNTCSSTYDEEQCSYWPPCIKQNISTSQCVGGCCLFIAFILIMILVPLSFSYVEYDQYALKKHSIKNTVETDKTYTLGRYYWGVDRKPMQFPRHFQKVTETFSIFPANGLEFDVDVTFWYRIQKNNLGLLFKAFGRTFNSQVINRANAKIKNIAPDFTLTQYITDRTTITSSLHGSLVDDLKEIYIDLPFDKFYLGKVQIPVEVRQRDLEAAIQIQRNVEEQNKQLAILVRKETDKLVGEVAAEINLIGLTASAEADRIQKEAEAVSEKIASSADGLGLQDLFTKINVTSTLTKEKYISYFAFLDSIN